MAKRSPRSKPTPRRPTVDNVIETRGLTKRFGVVVAVKDLDLQVHRGEVFGYLGPNGAGKSTTIRTLLDFIRPTSGTFALLGTEGAPPSIRSRIGYLPGEIRFDPRYSAKDLVEFYGEVRGVDDFTYFHELAERFELDVKRPVGELSTGNRRKVAIVQAFFHRPELLILDEPTAGLDPLLQQTFHDLVRQTRDAGATFFMSSHFLPEVEVLADRVGILREGELIEVASIAALQRRARQRIELHVSGPADPSVFERLPNVIEATKFRNVITVTVKGDVDAVMKAAAQLKVRRMYSQAAELEDIFLDLYRGEDK
jgi:ABC-2 type transport system ATP-binding protein